MQRKIYEKLIVWKNDEYKTLVSRGRKTNRQNNYY